LGTSLPSNSRAKCAKTRAKLAQECAPDPVLMCLCEILCQPELNFAKFSIHTCCSSAKFSLICLKESRNSERTLRGQKVPLKRTSGPSWVPQKRTFRLILLNLTKRRTLEAKSAGREPRTTAGLPPQRRGPVCGDPGLPLHRRGPVRGDPGVDRLRKKSGERANSARERLAGAEARLILRTLSARLNRLLRNYLAGRVIQSRRFGFARRRFCFLGGG